MYVDDELERHWKRGEVEAGVDSKGDEGVRLRGKVKCGGRMGVRAFSRGTAQCDNEKSTTDREWEEPFEASSCRKTAK